MRQFDMDDADDLQQLDDEQLSDFEARHAGLMSSLLAQEGQEWLGPASRLQPLRETKDEPKKEVDQRAASKRLEELRRAGKEREAEANRRRSRKNRGRDGPGL